MRPVAKSRTLLTAHPHCLHQPHRNSSRGHRSRLSPSTRSEGGLERPYDSGVRAIAGVLMLESLQQLYCRALLRHATEVSSVVNAVPILHETPDKTSIAPVYEALRVSGTRQVRPFANRIPRPDTATAGWKTTLLSWRGLISSGRWVPGQGPPPGRSPSACVRPPPALLEPGVAFCWRVVTRLECYLYSMGVRNCMV